MWAAVLSGEPGNCCPIPVPAQPVSAKLRGASFLEQMSWGVSRQCQSWGQHSPLCKAAPAQPVSSRAPTTLLPSSSKGPLPEPLRGKRSNALAARGSARIPRCRDKRNCGQRARCAPRASACTRAGSWALRQLQGPHGCWKRPLGPIHTRKDMQALRAGAEGAREQRRQGWALRRQQEGAGSFAMRCAPRKLCSELNSPSLVEGSQQDPAASCRQHPMERGVSSTWSSSQLPRLTFSWVERLGTKAEGGNSFRLLEAAGRKFARVLLSLLQNNRLHRAAAPDGSREPSSHGSSSGARRTSPWAIRTGGHCPRVTEQTQNRTPWQAAGTRTRSGKLGPAPAGAPAGRRDAGCSGPHSCLPRPPPACPITVHRQCRLTCTTAAPPGRKWIRGGGARSCLGTTRPNVLPSCLESAAGEVCSRRARGEPGASHTFWQKCTQGMDTCRPHSWAQLCSPAWTAAVTGSSATGPGRG